MIAEMLEAVSEISLAPKPEIARCHQCHEPFRDNDDECGACSRCRRCCKPSANLNMPWMIKSTQG